jgi:hypothetical protein
MPEEVLVTITYQRLTQRGQFLCKSENADDSLER